MAKFYNTIRKTGRVGGSVFRIVHGTTIESAYNPIVRNPNSAGQIVARRRFKTLSELSSVLSSSIAFRRQGLVSPRNLFLKKNIAKLTDAENMSEVNVTTLDLTGGVHSLSVPTLGTVGGTGSSITVAVNDSGAYDAMYYAVYGMIGNSLRFESEVIVKEKGDNNTFPYTFDNIIAGGAPKLVYAYGIKFEDESVRVRYMALDVNSATNMASLMSVLNVNENVFTLSETKAAVRQPSA